MKRSLYKDEIFRLKAEGKTGKEISKILNCSRSLISFFLNPDSKKNHQERSRIFKKTNRFAKKEEIKKK